MKNILLVNSDAVLLVEVAVRLARTGEFKIYRAHSVREALDIYLKHQEEIDCLITEMILAQSPALQEKAMKLDQEQEEHFTQLFAHEAAGRPFENPDAKEIMADIRINRMRYYYYLNLRGGADLVYFLAEIRGEDCLSLPTVFYTSSFETIAKKIAPDMVMPKSSEWIVMPADIAEIVRAINAVCQN